MRRSIPWLALVAICAAAVALRFCDLGRAAVRTDEINFLLQVARGQTLADLWANPPWLNQIPFADSIAIVWQWFRHAPPDEHSLRVPFTLLGCSTLVGSAVWLARRRGVSAGLLLATWMGLLPFHVYQSREAYYYVVAMAFAAGMTLYAVDLLVRLRAGESLPARAYAAWTAWAALTCLTHMSTWVVAVICWLLVLGGGVVGIPPPRRGKHVVAMTWSAVVLGAFMIRWVYRAVAELQRVSQGVGHIGGDFEWVAPRVIPFFTAGANPIGVTLSVILVGTGAYLWVLNRRKPESQRDDLYTTLTLVTAVGFVAVYAYVGAVGGGVAKVTYFCPLLPVFMAWSAFTLDSLAGRLPGRWPAALRTTLLCLALAGLAQPAWMVTRLEGKPVPYKRIRDWLDEHLDPGSVVIVDRWFEPWNEMAVYAPRKVFVTYTVPDEPYDTYVRLGWRNVTRQAIEQGAAQGFIRMTRNHERLDGLWTWPESYLSRRGVISNDVALWLHERGYVFDDRYDTSNFSRVVTEIFYDLRSDVVARMRARGDLFAVFFDQSLRHEKTAPLGVCRFQTPQFMDWRVLDGSGSFDVYNLTDAARRGRVRIRAISPVGPKVVVAASGERFEFAGAQLQEWVMGPLAFEPGARSLTITDPGWEDEKRPLLIQAVEVLPDTDVTP